MIDLEVPVRIVSEANQRGAWFAGYTRKKRQQAEVSRCLHTRERPPLPCKVTLTRYGAGLLDSDNMVGGFKHVRDQVAEWLGCGDSTRDPIKWVYGEQVKTTKDDAPRYWCRIEIEAVPSA